jgi:hypothetical protein
MDQELQTGAPPECPKRDAPPPEPTEPPTEVLPAVKQEVESTEGGLLVGRTIEQQYRLAQAYHKSGMLPQTFNTPERILTAMQYAYELGLQPLTAMRQLAIIKGVPSVFGDIPLALVKRSGFLERIEEYVFDEKHTKICFKNKNLDAKVMGAYCCVKRKGEDQVEKTWTLKDSEKAGLLGKDNWTQYPKTMLKYRARALAIKDVFPDVLTGIAIAEYDFDELPQGEKMKVVIPTTEEIKEKQSAMTPEKMALIEDISKAMLEMKMNEARTLQYFNQYLEGTQDMTFASEANLRELKRAVLDEFFKETSGRTRIGARENGTKKTKPKLKKAVRPKRTTPRKKT